MKAKWMCAVALGLQAWSTMSCATGLISTASMEVSMRIVESCAVQATLSATDKGAQVSCQHGSPYLVIAPAASQTPTPAPVTQTRPATDTAPAVVTVTF